MATAFNKGVFMQNEIKEYWTEINGQMIHVTVYPTAHGGEGLSYPSHDRGDIYLGDGGWWRGNLHNENN